MRRFMGGFVLWAAVAGSASTSTRPTSVMLLEQDPPADCQALGEVVGQDTGVTPRADEAQDAAMRKAAKLGATHVRMVRAKTGRMIFHTETWTGTAYRCPAKQ